MAKKKKRSRRPKRSSRSDVLAKQAFNAEPDEIVLEMEPSKEGGDFQDHLMVWYGAPKIGKSKTLHLIPGVYFLPTEPGYKWLTCRKTYIRNWSTFRKFVETMEKKPKFCKKIKLWCIDTVDNLAKGCMQYACGRADISHPSDKEWGAGWEAFADEFMHWICRLGVLGPGLAVISHETSYEVTIRGRKYNKHIPAMPKTAYKILNGMADMILRMAHEHTKKRKSGRTTITTTRVLLTQAGIDYDAGDRTELLPETIPFKTEKQLVKTLLECFEKGGSI